MAGILLLIAIVIAPAAVGEFVTWLAGGRVRVGSAVGAMVAAVNVASIGLFLTYCGMSDEPTSTCDDKIDAAPGFIAVGLVVVALAATVALARPSRGIRLALWATPTAMMLAVAVASRTALA